MTAAFLLFSKVLFFLLCLLVFCTPAWYVGLLARWPLGHVPFNGMNVPIGAAALLPLVVLVLWLVGRLSGPSRRLCWGPTWVTGPLLGLVALTLLGLRHNPDLGARATVGIGAVLLPLLYLYFVNEMGDPRLLAWLFLGVTGLQSAVALGQFVGQSDIGLVSLGELRLDPTQAGISVVFAGETRWLRAYGLTAHPNILGGYLSLGLLLLPGLYLSSTARWRGALLLPYGLGLAALLASFSRSAWLAFAAGLALVLIVLLGSQVSRHRYGPALLRFGALTLAIVLTFSLAYSSLFVTRLARPGNPLEARSINERVGDARLALALTRAHPLGGVGSGNYLAAVQGLVRDEAGDHAPRTVHNLPLLLTVELGLLGGGLWLWLSLLWAVILWRRRQTLSQDPWALCTAASLLALAVIGSLDNYLWISVFWQAGFLLATVFGLGATVLERS